MNYVVNCYQRLQTLTKQPAEFYESKREWKICDVTLTNGEIKHLNIAKDVYDLTTVTCPFCFWSDKLQGVGAALWLYAAASGVLLLFNVWDVWLQPKNPSGGGERQSGTVNNIKHHE